MRRKVIDTQLALLLLRQVNNRNSLTYTLRTSHSLSTKDTVAELTRDVHTCLASLLRCDQQDIQNAANRIVMPLGPGLGFTHLDKLALPAFQVLPPDYKAPQLLLDQDKLPIPQLDTSSNCRCIVKSALSKMHILWTVAQVSSSSTPLLNMLQVSPSSSSTTA